MNIKNEKNEKMKNKGHTQRQPFSLTKSTNLPSPSSLDGNQNSDQSIAKHSETTE